MKKKSEKTISREVTEVVTIGTYIDYNSDNVQHKYMMVIRESGNDSCCILLENSTDQIILCDLKNDKYHEQMKTIIQ